MTEKSTLNSRPLYPLYPSNPFKLTARAKKEMNQQLTWCPCSTSTSASSLMLCSAKSRSVRMTS